MIELLGMLLDFLDALAGAVAIACWWCTWVSPSTPAAATQAHRSDGLEVEHFLLQARSCAGSRRLGP
jgi:hypothetical protein